MPIKSKAQRRKFAQLLLEGKISEEVYEEWNRGAGSKELPERLHPKKDEKPKRGARTVARKKSARRKSTAKKPAMKKPAMKKPVRTKAARQRASPRRRS